MENLDWEFYRLMFDYELCVSDIVDLAIYAIDFRVSERMDAFKRDVWNIWI